MSLLPFIVAFLMLFGVLSYHQTRCFMTHIFSQKIYDGYRISHASAQIHYEKSLMHEIRVKDSKDPHTRGKEKPGIQKIRKIPSIARSVPLKFNLARIPNNARLNIWLLLNESSENAKYEFSIYEIFAALMRNLYKEQPFFNEIPHVEYHILDELIKKRKEIFQFENFDQISSLSFEDPKLQKVFYLMLKGSPRIDENCPAAPSLLYYLTYDSPSDFRKKRINLLFAPQPILLAVLKNEAIVEQVLQMRSAIWEKMLAFEANYQHIAKEDALTRGKISKEVEAEYKKIIDKFGLDPAYEKLFDYTVGHQGNVLIVEDPQTKLKVRQWIPQPSKKKIKVELSD